MDSDTLPLSRATIDRDALVRTQPGALAAAWSDPRVRLLVVDGHRVPLVGERLHLTHPDAATRVRQAELAEAADQTATRWWYLGTDEDGPVFGIDAAHAQEFVATPTLAEATELDSPAEFSLVDLRTIGAGLPAREAGIATGAVALANWHASHTHCNRCGAPTVMSQAGWVRICTVDKTEHFPRTDAAVIMAIIDAEDRILLAHNALWPAGRFSVPAGYVEPGEPLEAAVRRETWEETAVRVGRVDYQGSQPWPFPASLMVAFRGEALTTEPVPDGHEITEVMFVSRAELAARVADSSILLPQGTSIARVLIEDWYGGPLADSPPAGAR